MTDTPRAASVPLILDEAALSRTTGGSSFSGHMLVGNKYDGVPPASASTLDLLDDASNTHWAMGGDDTVNGMGGNDTLRGNAGHDEVIGDTGNDKLFGDAGDDTLSGGEGNDELRGGAGQDLLNGGAGRDYLDGGIGHDTLEAGEGRDTLFGGTGHDDLAGGGEDDHLQGAIGDDTLEGGDGNDTMVGGWGSDTFVINAGESGSDTLAGHHEIATGEWMARHDTDSIVIQGQLGWDDVRIEFRSGGFSGPPGADGVQMLKGNSSGVMYIGDQKVEFRGIDRIELGYARD